MIWSEEENWFVKAAEEDLEEFESHMRYKEECDVIFSEEYESSLIMSF